MQHKPRFFIILPMFCLENNKKERQKYWTAAHSSEHIYANVDGSIIMWIMKYLCCISYKQISAFLTEHFSLTHTRLYFSVLLETFHWLPLCLYWGKWYSHISPVNTTLTETFCIFAFHPKNLSRLQEFVLDSKIIAKIIQCALCLSWRNAQMKMHFFCVVLFRTDRHTRV